MGRGCLHPEDHVERITRQDLRPRHVCLVLQRAAQCTVVSVAQVSIPDQ